MTNRIIINNQNATQPCWSMWKKLRVWALYSSGWSYSRIARRLGVSRSCIAGQIYRIRRSELITKVLWWRRV